MSLNEEIAKLDAELAKAKPSRSVQRTLIERISNLNPDSEIKTRIDKLTSDLNTQDFLDFTNNESESFFDDDFGELAPFEFAPGELEPFKPLDLEPGLDQPYLEPLDLDLEPLDLEPVLQPEPEEVDDFGDALPRAAVFQGPDGFVYSDPWDIFILKEIRTQALLRNFQTVNEVYEWFQGSQKTLRDREQRILSLARLLPYPPPLPHKTQFRFDLSPRDYALMRDRMNTDDYDFTPSFIKEVVNKTSKKKLLGYETYLKTEWESWKDLKVKCPQFAISIYKIVKDPENKIGPKFNWGPFRVRLFINERRMYISGFILSSAQFPSDLIDGFRDVNIVLSVTGKTEMRMPIEIDDNPDERDLDDFIDENSKFDKMVVNAKSKSVLLTNLENLSYTLRVNDLGEITTRHSAPLPRISFIERHLQWSFEFTREIFWSSCPKFLEGARTTLQK